MFQNANSLPDNTGKSKEIIRPTNEVFKHLLLTNKWTDLTITLSNQIFLVHRNIICSAIPYFDTMMSSEFKESRQHRVTLNHPIDTEAFECLINWAYSFKINIILTNVRCLLVASDYLHVTEVFEACCEYLDSVLNIEAALEIKRIIKDLEVGKLASKVTALIIGNFTVISKTKIWFELPIKVLTEYLEDSDAVGFDENEIVDAILRWAEYKPGSRQKYLSSLLKLVKWKFVDPTIMVKKVASHELVKGNESCHELLVEVFKFMMFQCTKSSSTSYWKSPRVYKYNGAVMMALVQVQGKLQCFILLPYSSEWKQWMTLDIDISGPLLVAATDKYLYIYSEITRSSTCIHLPSKTYRKTKSAYVHRITASHDEFFITESRNEQQSGHRIKSIKYLSSNPKETNVSRMVFRLHEYEFVYLNNTLYFIGGSRKDKKESTELQKYDIAQSKWTCLTPMIFPRFNPHVAALDDKIYVIGGKPANSNRNAEYYDLNLNKWFFFHFPKNENDVKFLVAFCSKLYAFMNRHLNSVYIYDPKTDKWEQGSKVYFCDVLSVISIPNFTSFTVN